MLLTQKERETEKEGAFSFPPQLNEPKKSYARLKSSEVRDAVGPPAVQSRQKSPQFAQRPAKVRHDTKKSKRCFAKADLDKLNEKKRRL